MVFKNTLKSILAQDFFVKLDYFVNLFYAFWGVSCYVLSSFLSQIYLALLKTAVKALESSFF